MLVPGKSADLTCTGPWKQQALVAIIITYQALSLWATLVDHFSWSHHDAARSQSVLRTDSYRNLPFASLTLLIGCPHVSHAHKQRKVAVIVSQAAQPSQGFATPTPELLYKSGVAPCSTPLGLQQPAVK